ncbi:hypothetical protein H0H93_011265 [Arthromyces matolae]|nr:hypothetical protein H0H93_011265 [Arthromyces matolae]
MSATSGISVNAQLAQTFAATNDARFIKVSIQNEQLIHDLIIPAAASFEEDLSLLPDILDDDVPAYILAKVAPSDWLAISYVPDSAKVRDKMLYASSRSSLLKALGSTIFTDSIFATTKADLTPEAYAAHRRHINAPKPLSRREQELANVRAAEGGGAYEGSRARVNHIGTGVGLQWSPDLEDAVKQLAEGDESTIVIIGIDTPTETLVLKSASEASVESLSTLVPGSQPSYVLFAWPHHYTSPPRRDIVYIYSCPSSSPIKDRMIYSSAVSTTYEAAKMLLADASATTRVASRKIETSDPIELDEAFLKTELGLDGEILPSGNSVEKRAFARPRGPATIEHTGTLPHVGPHNDSGRDGMKDTYRHHSSAVGRALAASDHSLIYGGGMQGLMGIVAEAVLKNGGSVTGVIPYAMHVAGGERDKAARAQSASGSPPFATEPSGTGSHDNDRVVVDSMHERKVEMASRSKAFIGLPGGFGTFEEVTVVLINVRLYYDPLRQLIDNGIREGYINPANRDLIIFVDGPSDLDEHENYDWGTAALDAIDSWEGANIKQLFDWTHRKDGSSSEALRST